MNKFTRIAFLIILVALMASCANHMAIPEAPEGHSPAGFLDGLFNGIFVGFAFLGNLLGGDYALYAVYNTGLAYDFGYVWGVGGIAFTINKTRTRGE